jgi:hypothetical protein
MQNWRSWNKNNGGGGGGDDDHDEPQFQNPKQFKRNIPPNQQTGFNSFNGNSNNNNVLKPDFYPSSPVAHQPAPYNPQPSTFNPQSFQSDDDDDEDENSQPFNFQVNYNEGDNKNFQTNFHEPSFKKSPQVGAPHHPQHPSYPSSSGFTPSTFPTSVNYNSGEPTPSDEPSGGFYGGGEDGVRGGGGGQPGFDFPPSFGDIKDGRNGGVSQSYSTFTGPDGKSNGFIVKDHNNGGQPAQPVNT